MSRLAVALLAAGLAACGGESAPPPMVVGSFVDDYGNRYDVGATAWVQGASRYHIVLWNPEGRYAIARNDSANASDAGKWSRIDWLPLEGMAPWTWAFCYSSYNAPSRAVAETVSVARRDTPRTGCNGFPFSRMRVADST